MSVFLATGSAAGQWGSMFRRRYIRLLLLRSRSMSLETLIVLAYMVNNLRTKSWMCSTIMRNLSTMNKMEEIRDLQPVSPDSESNSATDENGRISYQDDHH